MILRRSRRWASKAWICCLTTFKDRHRAVMGASYTELFFLDEVTALAAGHRPCFECRRADARAFAESWRRVKGLEAPPRAAEMDRVLHGERLAGRDKRLHEIGGAALPDGTMIAIDGAAFALRQGKLLRWSHGGYTEATPATAIAGGRVLTPPAIVAVLADGFTPRWHPSALKL